MFRAANHSSYPAVAGEPPALAVADQARSFVEIVTDGLLDWTGPFWPLLALDGVEAADGSAVVTARLARSRPVVLDAFRAALEVGPKGLKAVLPGPVTIARGVDDRHYGDPASLARAVARCWAEEAAALREAGCAFLQIDEPVLVEGGRDLDLVRECASTIFAAAGEGATTILSTDGGDLASLGGRVAELPGTHLGLDLVASDAGFEVVSRLPKGRGVVLGLFDPSREEVEDAAEVFARLEPHREILRGRDLIVGPAAGLGGLDRDAAFEKLLHARYLAELMRKEWRE